MLFLFVAYRFQGADFDRLVCGQDAGHQAHQRGENQRCQHQPGRDNGNRSTAAAHVVAAAHQAGQVQPLPQRGQVVQNKAGNQTDAQPDQAALRLPVSPPLPVPDGELLQAYSGACLGGTGPHREVSPLRRTESTD